MAKDEKKVVVQPAVGQYRHRIDVIAESMKAQAEVEKEEEKVALPKKAKFL